MAKKLVCAVLFVVVVMIACEVIRQTVGLDAGQFEDGWLRRSSSRRVGGVA